MRGLFTSIIAESVSSKRDPNDDFWFNGIGPMSSAGVHVTHERAMQVAAVMACVKVISETAASLPLPVFRRGERGDKQKLDEHPVEVLMHDAPNEEQTPMEFREAVIGHAVSRGTGIADITPPMDGWPVGQLIPIHPDHWRPIHAEGSRQWFVEINIPGEPTRRKPREEFFIVRAMHSDPTGICGVDPITVERHTIGAALAVQDYAARFFANDVQQGGIVKHPGKFANDDDRTRFLAALRRARTGKNAHGALLLEHGMEWIPTTVTNEQAQFLETRKYHDTDIARIFRVPPHKIGILDRATFSNIEQQAIEFVVDTMLPWLVRFEQAVKRDLLYGPRNKGVYCEHNVNGLLRGDIRSRYEAYAIGRNWGWLSANDVRRLENMNSLGDDGDLYLRPLNMAPAGDPADPSSQGKPKNGEDMGAFTNQQGVEAWPKH